MKYVLVDRYLELRKGQLGRAVKTITHGEDFLEYQISPLACLPASLLIEAQAQTAGILVSATYDFRGKAILAKVDRADFYRPVTVGDRLLMTARMRDMRDWSCALETEGAVSAHLEARMRSPYAGLELTGEEGQSFDVPLFYANRADLMRALGVLDLLGIDAETLARAGSRGLAVGKTQVPAPAAQGAAESGGPAADAPGPARR
jgi:3-hydroxymyristoyl/3-hydroxydecanoyl-(acyl carrier protein) dehydratase